MLCRIYSATCIGLEVIKVTVEVSITVGVGIFLVGLPDNAVRESLLRVTTALQNLGYRVPGHKTVINMAPADLKKEGSSFDAAIAVALLCSSGQISGSGTGEFLILGELSLDGVLRPVPGALPIAVRAAGMGFKACIFPKDSAMEAAEVEGVDVFGAGDFAEVVDILNGEGYTDSFIITPSREMTHERIIRDDFSDVMGQEFAKRGLEVAASGGHNILLTGPPGAGKSFMARCLAGILPPMSRKEAMETSMIYSVAGKGEGRRGLMSCRPFRSPHHTASVVSLVGGGQNAGPGEISLAHNGILYLDEMSQYSASVLDVLRQPMEDRCISISRAKYKVTYPASFMLVGSMNPCPCGYYGSDRCTCTPGIIARYQSRISGPLLDRIDLNIKVKAVDTKSLLSGRKGEPGAEMARRVEKARMIQLERFSEDSGCYTNSQMNADQLSKYCALGEPEKMFLDKVMETYGMSARGYSRILKISRTIADMDGSERIRTVHISEAVHYRFQGN